MPSPNPAAPIYEDLLTKVKELKEEDQHRLLSDLMSSENFGDMVENLKKEVKQRLRHNLISQRLLKSLASRSWSKEDREELGLILKVPIFVQDPAVARKNHDFDPDQNPIDVNWQPGLSEGPTSARLAVVDYDGDTKHLEPPARWKQEQWCFVDPKDQPLTGKQWDIPQFHQLNVWAIVQRVLDFYEDTNALGRPVPWAFNGNRLIIVPHAGYGQNACYDPGSKSLQFFYFDDEHSRVYTCLSHDIVAHETGHAVLDGIRPYFLDGYTLQTGAFHEFIADLTAILSGLRNNDVRRIFTDFLEKDLPEADFLPGLAEEFSKAVKNRPYLRSAKNKCTMDDVQPGQDPHFCSQVLTGLIFDVLLRLWKSYRYERGKPDKPPSADTASWWLTQRIIHLALQPLDYLPPVDVNFVDYARALLQRDYLLYPDDPFKYRASIREACNTRKIPVPPEDLPPEQPSGLTSPHISDLLASRTAAYHYLHTNRKTLRIPAHQDIVVVDVYAAKKAGPPPIHLPRDVIVQYLWTEDVFLEDDRFGPLAGRVLPLLCGGTLVFDENGNFLYWVEKPGTEVQVTVGKKETKAQREGQEAQKEGARRKQELLDYVAGCVAAGETAVYERLTTGRFTTRASLSASPLAQLMGLPTPPRFTSSAKEDCNE